jgi:nucleotide-binding universal stress UspA family protein
MSLSKASYLAGVPTETRVLAGMAADAILDETRIQKADAIVMTAHGRSGFVRRVLGSVTQRVVRGARVPVLLVREASPDPASSAFQGAGRFRVLVPLDGSPLAEMALVPAIELARALAGPRGIALHLLRVPESPARLVRAGLARADALEPSALEAIRADALAYLAIVAERLRAGALAGSEHTLTWSAELGEDPARAIVATAEDRVGEHMDEPEGAPAYQMIAMATHGRGGLERLALSSITERVMDGTRLPVLIMSARRVVEELAVPVRQG